MEARDPARQPERTRLSWRRTILAVTVVSLLAVRLSIHPQVTPMRLLGTVATVLLWLAVLVVSHRRIVLLSVRRPDRVRWALPLAALAVAGFAGIGVALVATAPG